MTISKQLLEKLACPKCRGALEVVTAGGGHGAASGTDVEGLGCHACNLLYEVRDGIPAMIVEQAQSLSGDRP